MSSAIIRAANLYSVDLWRSEPWCSHAHRRRSSGRRAHSTFRRGDHVPSRVPATSDRYRSDAASSSQASS